jgi:hypothetical protein
VVVALSVHGHIGIQVVLKEWLTRILLQRAFLEIANVGSNGEVLLGLIRGRDGPGLVEGLEQAAVLSVLPKSGQEQVDLREDTFDLYIMLLEVCFHEGVTGLPLSHHVTDQDVDSLGTRGRVHGVVVIVGRIVRPGVALLTETFLVFGVGGFELGVAGSVLTFAVGLPWSVDKALFDL